jgi:hypothetical protein
VEKVILFWQRWDFLSKKVDLAKKDYFFDKKKVKLFFTLEFHAGITFFHAARCSVKKNSSSVKKSHFSMKKTGFFTLASMKKVDLAKKYYFFDEKK